MAEFKDRINEALETRKMKAADLAKLSGVNEGAISQYRIGAYKATQRTLDKLSKALNVSVPWLMGYDVPMERETEEIPTTQQSIDIGQRIKSLREENQMTQEELGNIIGVNKATINRYETGVIDIKRTVAIKLAAALHTTPAHLMGWDSESDIKSSRVGIGKRLREARQSRNLKQDELAKLIGVTASAIANYENDISHPKEVVLYKLFEVLEVEPNFIFQDVVSIKKEAPSPTEEKLLQKVRKLNATGRKKADEYITDLSENPKYTEPRPLDEVSKDISRELSQITGTTAKRSTTSK